MGDFPKENQHFFTNPMDKEEDSDSLRVILRSDNERTGIEFTWSVWPPRRAKHEQGRRQRDPIAVQLYHIFNKGGHIAGRNAYKTNDDDNQMNSENKKRVSKAT